MMCKMKKVLFLMISLMAASAASAQEVSLSVNDCIVLSESNNPYIKNTYLDIQSARFQKKEVFAEYFPHMSFRMIGISSYDYLIDIVIGSELGEMAREYEMGGTTKFGFNATVTLIPIAAWDLANETSRALAAGEKYEGMLDGEGNIPTDEGVG